MDAAGGVAIAGRTGSQAFPSTPDALQTFRGSDFDAFFSRFDATGALVHSTYLGGSENDAAFGVAIDSANRAYVVGGTRSPDFPATQSAFQGSNFSTDAFLSAFAPGGALLYSTFLGGSFVDRGNAVAVDPRGRVIVVGQASSPDFPSVSTTQAIYGGGPNDAFVAAIDPSASGDASLVFSTFSAVRATTARTPSRRLRVGGVGGRTGGAIGFPIRRSDLHPGRRGLERRLRRGSTSRRRRPCAFRRSSEVRATTARTASPRPLRETRSSPAGPTRPGFRPNASRYGPGGGTDAFVLRIAGAGLPVLASVPTLSPTALAVLAGALAAAGLALARRA